MNDHDDSMNMQIRLWCHLGTFSDFWACKSYFCLKRPSKTDLSWTPSRRGNTRSSNKSCWFYAEHLSSDQVTLCVCLYERVGDVFSSSSEQEVDLVQTQLFFYRKPRGICVCACVCVFAVWCFGSLSGLWWWFWHAIMITVPSCVVSAEQQSTKNTQNFHSNKM